MGAKVRPAFWQPQPRWPLEVRRFLQARVEAALKSPGKRSLLVWPAILGAPAQRRLHPEGIPEAELIRLATKMISPLNVGDPGALWAEDAESLPDTAARSAAGWSPHPSWEPFAPLVSLRSAVTLLALTGQPEDDRYVLACGVGLFNLSLFHECHDALEILWRRAEGDLKTGLQGLILLTCGFHHQQQQNAAGMRNIWRDGIPRLCASQGALETPWGRVGYAESLAMVMQRLDWLKSEDIGALPARFWDMPPPEWEFT